MIPVRGIRLDSSDTAARAAGWAGRADQIEGVLTCDPDSLVSRFISLHGNPVREWDDPLEALRWMSSVNIAEGPSQKARWVGFLSYDLGRLFEQLPRRLPPDPGVPLFAFALARWDFNGAPGELLSDLLPAAPVIRSTFDAATYQDAVRRVVDYIAAGDVFQVNLSQRFTIGAHERGAAEVYGRLLGSGGVSFGALLQFRDFSLVSGSPELFLRVAPDRRIITRPIKGTRPRLPGMREELVASAKDAAELNMIIDLERNDLGRVCEIGSVKVTQPRAIEEHPTLYHGVATVEGVLREDVGFVDLLRATFPGGSVTGAPKIRAMEIIEELEPVRRGPYCGAIGYLAADGSMQFNLAIRTMTFKDGLVHVPVGGGIVADSDPRAEYEETLVKARAMFDALGVVVERHSR